MNNNTMNNNTMSNNTMSINIITRKVPADKWAQSASIEDLIQSIQSIRGVHCWMDLSTKVKAGHALASLRTALGSWTEVAEMVGIQRSTIFGLRHRLQVEDERTGAVCRLTPILLEVDVTEDIHEAFEHLRDVIYEDDVSDLLFEALESLGSLLGLVEEEEDDRPKAA